MSSKALEGDTNSHLIRYVRAVDQYAFEKNRLSQLQGVEWQTRWEAIRKFLFDKYSQTDSGVTTEVRTTEIKDYPSPELVKNLYKPALETLTDAIEVNLPHEDHESERGFRLAVVNYVLGVLMHPAMDGNGQSFRLLALSYIHEHCPEFQGKYFPIKYTSDPSETKIHGWSDSELHKIKFEYPENAMTSEDLELLQNLKDACSISWTVMTGGKDVPQEELGDWMDASRDELVDEILRKMNLTMAEIMPEGGLLPDIAIAKYIGEILSRRYPGYVFEMYPQKKHEKTYLFFRT